MEPQPTSLDTVHHLVHLLGKAPDDMFFCRVLAETGLEQVLKRLADVGRLAGCLLLVDGLEAMSINANATPEGVAFVKAEVGSDRINGAGALA